MEDRIIRLEELVALQDRTIEKLSDELAAQQTELLELSRQVRMLGERLRSVAASGAGGDGEEGPEPPPPHYL